MSHKWQNVALLDKICKKDCKMKKILAGGISILFCAYSLYGVEGASAAHFSSPKGKQVGGIVGKTAFFMYNDNEASKVADPTTLNAMAAVAKKQICQGKDTRMLVEDMNMQVMFVYPNRKDGSVTVLTVENCKGIDKESKKK